MCGRQPHVRADQVLTASPAAALGDRIDGWRVCWLGGWDRCRVFFLVMVESQDGSPEPYSAIAGSYDDPLR